MTVFQATIFELWCNLILEKCLQSLTFNLLNCVRSCVGKPFSITYLSFSDFRDDKNVKDEWFLAFDCLNFNSLITN